jgi:hypothetical protein
VVRRKGELERAAGFALVTAELAMGGAVGALEALIAIAAALRGAGVEAGAALPNTNERAADSSGS